MLGGIFKSITQWPVKSIANLIERRPGLILIPLYVTSIFLIGLFGHNAGIIDNLVCPQLGAITLYSTPAEIIQCFGGMDIASYVRGAFALQEHGLNAFGSLGFATWPPGFSFLELTLIRLNYVPLPLALFLIVSSLWAFVFLRLYALLKQSAGISPVYAAGLPLLLLLVPFVSGFYLWEGILMSEPISTALFAIAALDLWRLVANKLQITLTRAIFIGVLFALAAYLRAQLDLIVHAIAGGAFFVIVTYYFYLRKNRKAQQRQELTRLAKRIFIIFISFQACVLPYKIYMLKHGHGLAMANVSYTFENLWKDENWHIQHGAGFVSAGGGHSMCAVSSQKCREFEVRRAQGEAISWKEYRDSAFEVALTQPFALLRFKWPYFWKAWEINNFEDPFKSFKQVWSMNFNYALFVLIFVTSVCRIIQDRFQGLVETALFSAFFIGSTAFSFIAHFEARYLLPAKFFVVLWVLVTAASIGKSFFQRNRGGI